MAAEVTQRLGLSMQVCIPDDWDNDQATAFAESENPCGTEHGWKVRQAGDPALRGCAERARCEGRAGHVHLMLDA